MKRTAVEASVRNLLGKSGREEGRERSRNLFLEQKAVPTSGLVEAATPYNACQDRRVL
jgi:hypothetical protein